MKRWYYLRTTKGDKHRMFAEDACDALIVYMDANPGSKVTGGEAHIFVESTNEDVAVTWNADKFRAELRDG